MMDKAARELGMDPLEIRRLNAPDSSATLNANQGPVTQCLHGGGQLVQGAELFNWSERRKRSGERNGSKITGIGVGQGYHSAGASGFDGLVRITPDGKIHLHSGVGNAGHVFLRIHHPCCRRAVAVQLEQLRHSPRQLGAATCPGAAIRPAATPPSPTPGRTMLPPKICCGK